MLAAHVANTMQADLLIFLTNCDGLYDRDPRIPGAKIIPEVTAVTDQIKACVSGPTTNQRSSGGMITKISAAVMAAKSAKTIILNGNNPSLILDVLKGANVGTYFDLRK